MGVRLVHALKDWEIVLEGELGVSRHPVTHTACAEPQFPQVVRVCHYCPSLDFCLFYEWAQCSRFRVP